jgi:hypothetical protein
MSNSGGQHTQLTTLHVDRMMILAYVPILFKRFLRLLGGPRSMSGDSTPATDAGKAGDFARCGSRMRGGGICERPPVPGKRRCRRHGGAPNHGAPRGNRNAEKEGLRTREAIAEQREVTEIIREGRRLIEMIKRRGK